MTFADGRVVKATARKDGRSWFLDRSVVQHLVPERFVPQPGRLLAAGPAVTECGQTVEGFDEGWLDIRLGDTRNCHDCMRVQLDRALADGPREVIARQHRWLLTLVEVHPAKAWLSYIGPQGNYASGEERMPTHVEGQRVEWLLLDWEFVELWRQATDSRRPELVDVWERPDLMPPEEVAEEAEEDDD
jgi:hypothetical protein